MIKKIDIALELLDRAIHCYMNSKEYFSAIHLAGASEELLGEYVRDIGGKDILTSFAEAMHKIGLLDGNVLPVKENKKHLNNVKNSIKHKNNVHDDRIEIDEEMEARDMIERSISNFSTLNHNPTKNIIEYYKHDRQHS